MMGSIGVKKTVITANHASREFLHKLNEMRWNKALVDVSLTGDNESWVEGGTKEILAHKLLLCGCSQYFNTLFGSHWDTGSDAKEPGSIDRVHVGGVTHDSLKLLVDFMYKGLIEISEENAADILVAADLLLMERLKDAICKFMQTIICAANCVFISKLADIYSCR